ncbi:MAG: hypothetical protein ABI779_24495 [Acidobacteriota bacterium]
MSRYQNIVGGSWEQSTLFAESVPHLFHYDMTYLWVLEQQPDQRPKSWASRIDAWRLLIRLFFLDQVTIKGEELRAPLLGVGERFGVNRITWLRNRQSNQPMGVLSPTVIVRPLPDFEEGDLERWKLDLKDNDDEFRHLIYVAMRDLQRAAGLGTFAVRLAEIMRREFTAAESTRRPPAGRAVTVPLLRRLTWERREGEGAPLASVDLSVRSGGAEIPEFIPRCRACGTLLLDEASAPAIVITDPVVRITCSNSGCSSPQQELHLDLFGIWLKSHSTAIVWTPERVPPMPDLKLPPSPQITGNELLYEWNLAAIGGEDRRRFLRLQLVDRHVQQVPLMSIFFDRLLVPGNLKDFEGLPLLPEWVEAVSQSIPPEIRPSSERQQVEFRNLKIHGWPVAFEKFYKELSLQLEPGVSLGLFPDPSLVGPKWKWFRSFVHGPAREAVELTSIGGTPLIKNALFSHEGGMPAALGLRSSVQRSTGVAYVPKRHDPDLTWGGTATASIAVDFGTTNTIVYYQPKGGRIVARAATHGLDPRRFAERVQWLAQNDSWANDEVIGGFLPGPRYRPNAVDRYIIPSEVWRIGRDGIPLIRWNSVPPGSGAPSMTAQFKWDSKELGEEGNAPTRRAYLREVLLQSLPAVLQAFDPVRVAAVRVGTAYPLAFEHQARVGFRSVLDEVAREVAALTGLEVNAAFSINESKACVNAFGSFNHETFLVADMGGGTLDVALFSVDPDETIAIHQMGSLRYAGEDCVKALSEQTPDSNDAEQRRSELRDAIGRGESSKKFGKHSSEKIVTQFATIAFEFLRTMVAAYRKSKSGAVGKGRAAAKSPSEGKGVPPEEIRLVLVGNGWHLIEAFSGETADKGARRVYSDVYGSIVRAVGDPMLTLYEERPLSELPSSKHLVVIGALQNVTDEKAQLDELTEEHVALAKLPAGRPMVVGTTSLDWASLVGEGIELPGRLDLASVSSLQILVEKKKAPPANDPAWAVRFANSVGTGKGGELPYPTDPDLLRELRNGIGGEPPKMRKGPLQLILELEWAEALQKRRGSVK